jgi:transposase
MNGLGRLARTSREGHPPLWREFSGDVLSANPFAMGLRFLRAELPGILSAPPDVLSARMVRIIVDLFGDWRRLDERIEGLSSEIEAIARQDCGCERLMSVPGIGPIISSAMVAAIGAGDGFSKGRDFAAWLGLVPKQISTGDRTILGKISRRGNRYLRVLFVQAAGSESGRLRS